MDYHILTIRCNPMVRISGFDPDNLGSIPSVDVKQNVNNGNGSPWTRCHVGSTPAILIISTYDEIGRHA